MAKARFDVISLQRIITNDIKRGKTNTAVKKILRERAEDGGLKIAEALTLALENHPVTKELQAGAGAASSFFPKIKGKSSGNLAAFYGLEPVRVQEAIANFISLFHSYEVVVTSSGTDFNIQVKFPTIEKFYKAAPSPEAYGGSWLQTLEQVGDFGGTFEHFLFPFVSPISRSGSGIQSKYVIQKNTSFRVPSIPYISQIQDSVLQDAGVAKSILGRSVRRKI